MASLRPFAFAREFRCAPAEASRSPAELEAEIARLEQRVEEAHEEGRATGMAEALTTLRAERDTALLAATEALLASLATFDQRQAEMEQSVSRLGAELALDLADHLAARAIERDPVAAIDQALGRALRQVRRGQPLRLRVAPELEQAVQHRLSERQASERRRLPVTVLGDSDVARGDARIDWEGGALLLDRDARGRAMAEEIAALFAA